MISTYLEAIREACAGQGAFADDPRVYIYGQDVGQFGGGFQGDQRARLSL